MNRRKLSRNEAAILHLVNTHYGRHNTEDQITFSDGGDAVIWVKDEAGSVPLMANLTNLAAWLADGTISSKEELLREWLRVEDN
jgi:hypothetical protein